MAWKRKGAPSVPRELRGLSLLHGCSAPGAAVCVNAPAKLCRPWGTQAPLEGTWLCLLGWSRVSPSVPRGEGRCWQAAGVCSSRLLQFPLVCPR